MHEGQSFYTANDKSAPQTNRKTKTDSDFQSALQSSTPYREMVDVHVKQVNKRIGLISETTSRNSEQDTTEKKSSPDQTKALVQEAVSERLSDVMSDKGHPISRASRSSDFIREKAKQILATYNQRLEKVGQNQF